eukprot:UN00645
MTTSINTTQYPFSGNHYNTNVSLTSMKHTIFISNALPTEPWLSTNILYLIITILVLIMFCFISCCVIFQYRASRQRKQDIFELAMKIDELIHVERVPKLKSVPTTTATPKSNFSPVANTNNTLPETPYSTNSTTFVIAPVRPPKIFASHDVSCTAYDTNPMYGLNTNKRKPSHSRSPSRSPSDSQSSSDDIPLPALTPTVDLVDDEAGAGRVTPLVLTGTDSILVNVPEDDVVETFDRKSEE